MNRIRFSKGKQRIFLKEVLLKLDCPTLRELADRFELNYSTMKNYFSEKRHLSDEVFSDLCFVSKIEEKDFNFEVLRGSFGQSLGGIKSRKHLNNL